jgi:hypothetical protein
MYTKTHHIYICTQTHTHTHTHTNTHTHIHTHTQRHADTDDLVGAVVGSDRELLLTLETHTAYLKLLLQPLDLLSQPRLCALCA